MDRAAHSSRLASRLASGVGTRPGSSFAHRPSQAPEASDQDDVYSEIRLSGSRPNGAAVQTGFDADALSALKPSTPATGSAATLPRDLADDPVAGCALKPALVLNRSQLPKQALLGSLRAEIRKIEGHVSLQASSVKDGPVEGGPGTAAQDIPEDAAWRFGCTEIDRRLPQGLDPGGVHEVKAAHQAAGASAGDWMTGFGFALRLAVRRVVKAPNDQPPWLLWCWPRALAAEFGVPLASGLASLGIDPARLLIVEPARASDALVALEDGLRSSSIALAFGVFEDIGLTPARRLSLTAAASGTPCLLITHPAAEPAAATATRWSVRREKSAPHIYDARAPGNARFSLNLERCRGTQENGGRRNAAAQNLGSLSVEWCDEARCFNLASILADRAVDAHEPRRGAKR